METTRRTLLVVHRLAVVKADDVGVALNQRDWKQGFLGAAEALSEHMSPLRGLAFAKNLQLQTATSSRTHARQLVPASHVTPQPQ